MAQFRAYKAALGISEVELKTMIISKIIGGLGNQMFQYAAGRALSLKRGQPLRLDVAGFVGYGLHHGFELQRVFDCQPVIADESDVRSILAWQFSSGIRRLVARQSLSVFRRKSYIVEPHFHYWPEINDVPQNCYLDGYWQSDKYFQGVSSVIRKDFTFKSPLADRNAEIAEHISQLNSVSLHIRRGDYATDPNTNATHGLCSLDYYREAVQYVADRIKQPYIFVFSDDIVWVKDNLKMDLPCQYIDHNHGTESYNDMRLMSMCRHHIIANSSFSWWGAWLNPSKEKIVVAPQKWFVNNNNVRDLFPRGWVTL